MSKYLRKLSILLSWVECAMLSNVMLIKVEISKKQKLS